MSKRKQYPSQEKLRELFDYDPEGFLVWRQREDIVGHISHRDAGKRAGSAYINDQGFLRMKIMINGSIYIAKNLIWIWHHGDPLDKYVKTKNRNDLDVRIENLTLSKNPYSHKPGNFNNRSSTGFKGVSRAGKNFKAEIQVDGVRTQLGNFSEAIDAAVAFDNKYEEVYGIRPNLTEHDFVQRITVAQSKQLAAMRKCIAEGRFMGVRKPKGRNRYAAFLKSKNVGTADTAEGAARIYNIAAYEHYGDKAVLNDIPDPLGKGDCF